MPVLPRTGLIPESGAYTISGLITGRKYLIVFSSTDWGDGSAVAAFNIGESYAFVDVVNGTFNSSHTEDTFIAPGDTLRLTASNVSAAIQVRIVLCKDA